MRVETDHSEIYFKSLFTYLEEVFLKIFVEKIDFYLTNSLTPPRSILGSLLIIRGDLGYQEVNVSLLPGLSFLVYFYFYSLCQRPGHNFLSISYVCLSELNTGLSLETSLTSVSCCKQTSRITS